MVERKGADLETVSDWADFSSSSGFIFPTTWTGCLPGLSSCPTLLSLSWIHSLWSFMVLMSLGIVMTGLGADGDTHKHLGAQRLAASFMSQSQQHEKSSMDVNPQLEWKAEVGSQYIASGVSNSKIFGLSPMAYRWTQSPSPAFQTSLGLHVTEKETSFLASPFQKFSNLCFSIWLWGQPQGDRDHLSWPSCDLGMERFAHIQPAWE